MDTGQRDIPAEQRVDPEQGGSRGWRGVTAVTALRPGRWQWLRLLGVFWFGRTWDVAIRPLLAMRVIALGRWTLWPSWWAPRVLIFETNWSGSPQNYIPDFGRVMPLQWQSIWGATVGFPGALPTQGLLRWVDRVDHGQGYLWTDYAPGATTQQIARALALRATLLDLLAGAAEQTPAQVADQLSVIETML